MHRTDGTKHPPPGFEERERPLDLGLKDKVILVSGGGKTIDRASLDDATGFKRSSRDAYLSRMMAKRLIEIPSSGMVRASEALFD